MRGWHRATDRAAGFGVPVVAWTSPNHMRGTVPFSNAVLTFSELAGGEASYATETTPSTHPRSFDVEYEERRQHSTSTSVPRFVDVDAVDVDEDDAVQELLTENGLLGAGGATSIAPVPSQIPTARHHLVRDSAILSYRDNAVESIQADLTLARGGAPSISPNADELLAIAVDESHIFLRRGGRVDVQSPRQQRSCSSVPSLRVWKAGLDEGGAGERARSSRSVGAGRRPTLFPPGRSTSVPIFSTQWRQEASALLPHAHNQLFRVCPRKGAQSSICFPSTSYSCARCQADFVALSSTAVSLVHAREEGTELTLLHHAIVDGHMSVNATCMDDWGAHSTVVGYSDGSLRVIDWRMPLSSAAPSTSDDGHSGIGNRSEDTRTSLCVTRVPQPRWLCTRRRNAFSPSSVAGVLSCCAMEDSFRVVCGLGDASGAVVVADLRKPDAPVHRKRSCHRKNDVQIESLFREVGGHPLTGHAITDICRDPLSFGQVGLVDVTGASVLTHISVLEGTHDATTESTPLQRWDSADMELTCSTESPSSPATSFSPSRRRARLPSPPAPWQVLARAERTASSSAVLSDSAPQSTSILTELHSSRLLPLVRGGGFFPRCIFTGDGSYFAHTAAGSVTSATLRCFSNTADNRGPRTCRSSLGATRLRLAPSTLHTAGSLPTSFVAVSCVDQLVCFDTSNGNTLSVLLH
ncbi:hypothetical protein ABL78_2025 [Leptomonas seymouri]|uniref:Uncharacterized protein n=1 Tax=Leptomonas seymouri TaxID=5684 RepID=A0A0N1I813_LEPSE|nr:hypothetical protein ABL78_2025 [Leptomonas seymouri]|eukprot:KPI88831.1 hypothetical protein ABL78_2025 [Leptomonas seymouri]